MEKSPVYYLRKEYIGLLEAEGQEVEPKHPLTFDESSTKDIVS